LADLQQVMAQALAALIHWAAKGAAEANTKSRARQTAAMPRILAKL
jgi:hypothetical protein